MEELFSRERNIPKGYLLLVPIVGFLVVIGTATYKQSNAPQPGEPVPDFTAPLLIGEGDLALADLEGKPVVINFWASWCGPCKHEAPLLKEAHERYGDRIEFLGIDIRDARSDALEFVETYDLDYTHVRDEDMRIYASYGLTGQPETFFVDDEGILVEHVAGPIEEDGLFRILDTLVARSA